jgi:predicted O-methyltransferase YrrM
MEAILKKIRKSIYHLRGLNGIYEAIAATKEVPGFMEFAACTALFFFAKSSPQEGAIVEIGSLAGRSTIWLAKGAQAKKRGRVYAVDPHTGDPYNESFAVMCQAFSRGQEYEFRKNITQAQVSDIVVPVVKTSEIAAKDFNKPVRFLFIDGIHEYDFVKKDFLAWSPKVIKGGIIAFHDRHLEGVDRLLKEYLYTSRDYTFMGTVHSIAFFRKGCGNPFLDKFFSLRFKIVFPQGGSHPNFIMRWLSRILKLLVF